MLDVLRVNNFCRSYALESKNVKHSQTVNVVSFPHAVFARWRSFGVLATNSRINNHSVIYYYDYCLWIGELCAIEEHQSRFGVGPEKRMIDWDVECECRLYEFCNRPETLHSIDWHWRNEHTDTEHRTVQRDWHPNRSGNSQDRLGAFSDTTLARYEIRTTGSRRNI